MYTGSICVRGDLDAVLRRRFMLDDERSETWLSVTLSGLLHDVAHWCTLGGVPENLPPSYMNLELMVTQKLEMLEAGTALRLGSAQYFAHFNDEEVGKRKAVQRELRALAVQSLAAPYVEMDVPYRDVKDAFVNEPHLLEPSVQELTRRARKHPSNVAVASKLATWLNNL